ncbi:MAG: ribosome maturation factor RimM [Cellvibrionaceae bacterium]
MKTERVTVGRITSVHGVKGWVKVYSHTRPPENIFSYKQWFVKTKHGLKEVELDEGRKQGKHLVAHLKGIDDRDAAQLYCQADIGILRSQLPGLEEGDYYWHQLEGLRVISDFDGKALDLGKVSRMMETGANDVLVVKGDEQSIDKGERLIPYVLDQFVTEVDLSEGQIRVEWDPEF